MRETVQALREAYSLVQTDSTADTVLAVVLVGSVVIPLILRYRRLVYRDTE